MRIVVKVIGMLSLDGGNRRRQRIAQFLMIIGGITTAVSGLLTAFIPDLAYVRVHDPPESTPYVEYLPLNLQLHNLTFGMLMSSVGGFLVLGSSIRRSKKLAFLSFAGDFLGILGFLIYTGDRPGTFIWTGYAFKMLWTGLSLTLLGVLLMFASSMVRYEGKYRLTLLGIPFLLISGLIKPILIAFNNLSYLLVLHGSVSANILLVSLALPGFALLIFGSVFNICRIYANNSRKTLEMA